jgi:hypothetical protein
MDRLPAHVSASHVAQLERMRASLLEDDREMRLLEASDDLLVPTLLVSFDRDEQGRERTLAISVMPFDDGALQATAMVQFYVPMPFEVRGEYRRDLLTATAAVNAAMVIGHFAVRDTEVYYRYVLACRHDTELGGRHLRELVTFVDFHQEHFGDYLEGVLDGAIAVEVLPEVIEATAD